MFEPIYDILNGFANRHTPKEIFNAVNNYDDEYKKLKFRKAGFEFSYRESDQRLCRYYEGEENKERYIFCALNKYIFVNPIKFNVNMSYIYKLRICYQKHQSKIVLNTIYNFIAKKSKIRVRTKLLNIFIEDKITNILRDKLIPRKKTCCCGLLTYKAKYNSVVSAEAANYLRLIETIEDFDNHVIIYIDHDALKTEIIEFCKDLCEDLKTINCEPATIPERYYELFSGVVGIRRDGFISGRYGKFSSEGIQKDIWEKDVKFYKKTKAGIGVVSEEGNQEFTEQSLLLKPHF